MIVISNVSVLSEVHLSTAVKQFNIPFDNHPKFLPIFSNEERRYAALFFFYNEVLHSLGSF